MNDFLRMLIGSPLTSSPVSLSLTENIQLHAVGNETSCF